MTRRKVCLWLVQTGLFIFSPQSFFFFCLQLANPVVQNPWMQQTGCTVEGILSLHILIEVLCYTSSPLYIMTCFGKRQKRSCNSLLSNLFLAKRACWTEYGLHKFRNHFSLSSTFNHKLETEYEAVHAEKDPESPWLNSSWDGAEFLLRCPLVWALSFCHVMN